MILHLPKILQGHFNICKGWLFISPFPDGIHGRWEVPDKGGGSWHCQVRSFACRLIKPSQSSSNLNGISINNDIEVDHHMAANPNDGGGASTATIVLAVILALVILAGIAVLLFVKRG